MSEIKQPAHLENEINLVDRAQQFWGKFGKQLTYGIAAIIIVIAECLAI